MIFQLTVFSLLILILHLAALLVGSTVLVGSVPKRNVPGKIPLPDRLEAVRNDAMGVYVLFAGLALLMFLLGKPDLLPQYMAWGVIVLQAARGVCLFIQRRLMARIAGVVIVGLLIYMWAERLPFFQDVPR
ncbi:MAG: hypothetical protein IID61_08290 [SAR324 cluster bacterium]|nr:hypothetical protein [SAR324 cluster bacterium]